MVVCIHNVHIPSRVARDPGRIVEVGVGYAEVPPEDNEVPAIIKLLDPIITVVHDKQGALLINRQSIERAHKLPAMEQRRATACLAPFGDAQIPGRVDQDGRAGRDRDIVAGVLEPHVDRLLSVLRRQRAGNCNPELVFRGHIHPARHAGGRCHGAFRDVIAGHARIHVDGGKRDEDIRRVRHERPMVDDRIGILRSRHVDEHRRGYHLFS